MTSALDITRSVNPPRAAFLDYPLGHTTGKPDDRALQRAILREALEAFTSLPAPGSVNMLGYHWAADEDWKRTALCGGDERQPRHDTPQYQCEQDRVLAEACAACIT
jgi:hypothetical protein